MKKIKELNELAKSNEWKDMAFVALDISVLRDLFIKLINDEGSQYDRLCSVRGSIEQNLYCSPEVFMKLAEDEDSRVRVCVARNRNCPPEVFMKLAEDKNCEVRKNVAANENCPQ